MSLRLSTGGFSLKHVNYASSLYDFIQSGPLNHIPSDRAIGDVPRKGISAEFSLLRQWLHISGDTIKAPYLKHLFLDELFPVNSLPPDPE